VLNEYVESLHGPGPRLARLGVAAPSRLLHEGDSQALAEPTCELVSGQRLWSARECLDLVDEIEVVLASALGIPDRAAQR
jgi:hypothetical protein